jgi:hypothetical protein
MARLADRIAYRFAGFVWTAIYGGLSRRDPSGSSSEMAPRAMSTQANAPEHAMAA